MRLRPSANVLAQPVGDELVLMDLSSGQYFSLNPVGASVWTFLQETSDLNRVRHLLLNLYDSDEAALTADLDRIIKDLVDAKLLKQEP